MIIDTDLWILGLLIIDVALISWMWFNNNLRDDQIAYLEKQVKSFDEEFDLQAELIHWLVLNTKKKEEAE
jgi:hypothetical protein